MGLVRSTELSLLVRALGTGLRVSVEPQENRMALHSAVPVLYQGPDFSRAV